MNRNIKTEILVKSAVVAGLYAVLTMTLGFMSYGPIQFRIAEVMTLLAFIDPLYIPGLVLGCAISNITSTIGIIDIIVGSFATLITVYLISKTKNLFIASLWPTINSVFVGAELYYVLGLPFWLSTLQVAIGEFVVVTLIGYPLFKYGILNNKNIVNTLKINKTNQ
ncbi:QueT transporter family protein [Clostridium ganghwense]|uniref:QueT transporter family protein n=1 Tax=Clostridium ganghwense TaxID=312089 RepID=A0ABT4CKX3_9CLOT|nr:QueT transporter family protein [Clostridium ganghwense]MCY6369588.1 QueT transporter family protein [Clostridium ganghwense]